MTKKIVAILLTAGSLLINACQKDLDMFVPDQGQFNGPDTSWYSAVTDVMPVAVLKNSLLLDTYSDSIDISSGSDTVTTPSGLQCIFPMNCCVNNAGQPVTGKIKVEVALLQKKGDMVRMNKPTTSNNRLLISGGQVYVGLKKENNDLQLAPNAKIEMNFADMVTNTGMKFFTGAQSGLIHFNWLDNPDVLNNTVTVGSQGYNIQTNQLRWVNCAYFFDTASITRSVVTTDLPSSYTNANTSVYLVFKDMRSVVSLTADIATKKFVSSKVPNGKDATIVVISKQGNDFFLGKQLISIAGPNNNTIEISVTPTKTTLAAITAYLDSL